MAVAEKLTAREELGKYRPEEEEEEWDDEEDEEEEEDYDDSDPDVLLCLFCDAQFHSLTSILEHCCSAHLFDFKSIRQTLGLDFYSSFKLINYVRSKVAENRCWSCGIACLSCKDLQNHLHATLNLMDNSKLPWEDEKYLKPFMQDDCLLHTFDEEDEDGQEKEDYNTPAYKEESLKELMTSQHLGTICFDDGDDNISESVAFNEIEKGRSPSSSSSSTSITDTRNIASEEIDLSLQKRKNRNTKVSFVKVAEKETKNVNESYFGAYSSFGIHKEMISDKVRMDAYRGAILNNPSLTNNAAVMDVGCGTGILSLFAAKAGASRVIGVEASEKMAKMATQIAKDNGLLRDESSAGGHDQCTRTISIVQSMVEKIDEHISIPPHSIDVLLSEWMGYCLLYESMLSSVLYARDRWLKPGGAMLPDTATIFVAGFGRGGTSIQFWENVYGFNMSSIGKEVLEDAARIPIVDVVDSCDIVTDAVVLQNFDLVTMKPDEMDFTASFELQLKLDHPENSKESDIIWCYGVVLWFETGFTERFCKEMPTVLSTSPYTPKTHWSQTILTFNEPIALAFGKPKAMIGTDSCPAVKIQSRISIARAAQHRSIDISLETAVISLDGQTHNRPVQIFTL